MVYKVYSVRDVKTSFAAPFIDANNDSAIRGFHYAFLNNANILNFSPDDFRLYCIGSFDSDTGIITPEPPAFVCDASSFRKAGVDDEK